MKDTVNIGEIWTNNKTGNAYKVVLLSTHSEDNSYLVSYERTEDCHPNAKKEIHSRPYDLFLEKFTKKDD